MNGSARTPMHLWIVGVVSTLWNAYGAYDYVMMQTRNDAWLASYPPEMLGYIEAFPVWMDAAWAIGVWGALVGALLLLVRSRHAVPAFGLSLAGLLVSTIYKYLLTPPPASMRDNATIAMWVAIWAVAIALFLYARRMRAKGVLR